ncbi:hypothetical protein B0H16DRAFT_1746014 [Mycena metata]|uniref:Uncharacterized protein n=1 Tax=Mycena metata TaxID=1033252 RepID=A0AAD7H0C0_9AGAR|nr:hypothetical protein B0H16DRAFT_1746014 [Mycena metata]
MSAFLPHERRLYHPTGLPRATMPHRAAGSAFAPLSASLYLPHPVLSLAPARSACRRHIVNTESTWHQLPLRMDFYGGGTRGAPGLPSPLPHLLHPRPRLSLHPRAGVHCPVVHVCGHVTLLFLVAAQRPRPPYPPSFPSPSASSLSPSSLTSARATTAPSSLSHFIPASLLYVCRSESLAAQRPTSFTLILVPASLLYPRERRRTLARRRACAAVCAYVSAVRLAHRAAPPRRSELADPAQVSARAREVCACVCAHVACTRPRRTAVPLPSSLSSCPPHT